MARFSFHLHDHVEVDDQEAREFPDVKAAIAAATKELREFLADQVLHGYLDGASGSRYATTAAAPSRP